LLNPYNPAASIKTAATKLLSAPAYLVIVIDRYQPAQLTGAKDYVGAALEARALRFGAGGKLECVQRYRVENAKNLFVDMRRGAAAPTALALERAAVKDLKFQLEVSGPSVPRY
jgi:hypothetical protein